MATDHNELLHQISRLPTSPIKDSPTHLGDHGTIARALQRFVPLLIEQGSQILSRAPAESPTFTGTVSIPSMRFTGGSSQGGAALGDVLTATGPNGTVGWREAPVTSVQGKSGAVQLTAADFRNELAPLDSPQFIGSISTPSIIISGEGQGPEPGQVLTAASEGGGSTWSAPFLHYEELPPPTRELRGHTALLMGPGSTDDELYVCLRKNGEYVWKRLGSGGGGGTSPDPDSDDGMFSATGLIPDPDNEGLYFTDGTDPDPGSEGLFRR